MVDVHFLAINARIDSAQSLQHRPSEIVIRPHSTTDLYKTVKVQKPWSTSFHRSPPLTRCPPRSFCSAILRKTLQTESHNIIIKQTEAVLSKLLPFKYHIPRVSLFATYETQYLEALFKPTALLIMSSPNPSEAGHSQRAQLSIPQFQPLPPNTFLNRIINKILAPFFYLIFTIITAIIVVPVYTIIENFKKGRGKKGGERFASSHEREVSGQPAGRNKAKEFLGSYSSSYSARGKAQ